MTTASPPIFFFPSSQFLSISLIEVSHARGGTDNVRPRLIYYLNLGGGGGAGFALAQAELHLQSDQTCALRSRVMRPQGMSVSTSNGLLRSPAEVSACVWRLGRSGRRPGGMADVTLLARARSRFSSSRPKTVEIWLSWALMMGSCRAGVGGEREETGRRKGMVAVPKT